MLSFIDIIGFIDFFHSIVCGGMNMYSETNETLR